jgi:hypothetical protein
MAARLTKSSVTRSRRKRKAMSMRVGSLGNVPRRMPQISRDGQALARLAERRSVHPLSWSSHRSKGTGEACAALPIGGTATRLPYLVAFGTAHRSPPDG